MTGWRAMKGVEVPPSEALDPTAALLHREVRQLLVMAGLAAAHQGWFELAASLQTILPEIVSDTDVLNWFQAVHFVCRGEFAKVKEKLLLSRLQEARDFLHLLEAWPGGLGKEIGNL